MTRETTHLAYLSGRDVVHVNKLFAAKRRALPSRIGGRAPAHCTGVGKVLMAHDPHATQAVLSQGLYPLTEHTITDPDILRKELVEARQQGFAFDRQEIQMGLTCVAAPIFSRARTPVAALSVSVQGTEEQLRPHIPALLKVCKAAGNAITAHPDGHP